MGNYKRDALEALSGHWKNAILVSIIATLLTGTVNINLSAEQLEELHTVFPELVRIVVAVMPAVGLYSLVVFLIGGLFEVGYCRYCIKLSCGTDGGVGELFAANRLFGKALVLKIVMTIKIVLWSLLFVIPGIVAAFRYAMAYFIMAADPDIDAMDAIEESKRMMDGNKLNLFFLYLSFIGWSLLIAAVVVAGTALISMGISVMTGIALIVISLLGSIALNVYMKMAVTAFYLELAGRPSIGQVIEY